ncbi:T9SS type A sorting domain-containing protein [Microvirga sp. STR05]|uniref:T9SS type A sorting domain-containing protein n=1 Tax=Hymenobacter duratus TaxID=2771356 RepID=A0ABR8JCH9_9BACT|nr:T9SS type A sorting domain-containing protein [Hymenobacter duratus]MBD2714487.1 T9SS type A sorting domain-containing protein [Hymenobacter duratus]MBR7949391.1 T9SS type A sorting domain-containing protein [Microvirga sp. STR05]
MSRFYAAHLWQRGGLALLAVLTAASAQAQVPSFPSAEGAGKFTSGGRGTVAVPTTVFEVTNLNDDNLPGSLRYALTTAATHRTIVFRVSGTIHLLSELRVTRANTTIAGQTAPGDGICLADYPFTISADNVIIRFARFRMGDKNQNQGMVNGSGSGDAFGGLSRKNIMVDHCTMSWSSDEACTLYRGDSTTLQWNLISEPLDYSYHFETGDTDFERHAYGGIWGGRTASFHHNLLAHMRGRMPRFDGSRNLTPNTAGQENADFRNNVIYNWASYNVNGGEGGNYNIVNNYYKSGPSTPTSSSGGVPIRSEVLNPYKQTSSPVLPYGKFYLTGNYVDGYPAVTARNWLGVVMSGGTRADTAQAKVTTPFPLPAVPTHTALDAYTAVLQKAGCVLPTRDALDQRIVQDVINRTGSLIDVQGGFPHGTPYAQTTGAWPVLNSLPAPTDTDHDGMPDTWELANGLNPNNAADRNNRGASGYTALENYLNGLTATVLSAPAAAQTAATALQLYPNPAQEQLMLAHPQAARGAQVQVYSLMGQLLTTVPVEPGSLETQVSTAALAPGSYLLHYTDGAVRLSARFGRQ